MRTTGRHKFDGPAALVLPLLLGSLLFVGCHSGPTAIQARAQLPPDPIPANPEPMIFDGPTSPEPFQSVEALVVPPAGWGQEPLKSSEKGEGTVWIRASG